MRRRDFLELTALSALASSCARPSVNRAALPPPPARRTFARVNVAEDRIIRTVVGLRPFRPSGFVVKAETFDSKLVVHNYGHGGGGMSLSWGTAHLALDLAMQSDHRRFAVLGCGGVGLATARLLQRRGYDVTIYAKDMPPNTTSNIAGAQWSPVTVFDRDKTTPQFMDQFDRASRLAFRYYQDLSGAEYGIRWIENYQLNDHPREPHAPTVNEQLFRDTRDLDPGQHPFASPYVHRFTTMLIEPPIYLTAMLRDYYLAGGKIIVRQFDSIADVIALPESVVINCTGLGAGAIFKDTEITPIKGQLSFLLPQPEIDYIALSGDLYMFPRRDGILLGGTHERGVWTLDPNLDLARQVLEGHQKLFSSMRV
jgi:D-amino-acid oxidase